MGLKFSFNDFVSFHQRINRKCKMEFNFAEIFSDKGQADLVMNKVHQ